MRKLIEALLILMICSFATSSTSADPTIISGPTVQIIDRVRNHYLTGLVRDWLSRSGYRVLSEGSGQYQCRIVALHFSYRSGRSRIRFPGGLGHFRSSSWMARAYFNLSGPDNVIIFDSSVTSKGSAQASFEVSANYKGYSLQANGIGATKELALENFFAQLPPAPAPPIAVYPPPQKYSNLESLSGFGSTSSAILAPSPSQLKVVKIALEQDGQRLAISGPAGTKICLRFFLRHPKYFVQKPIQVFKTIPPSGLLHFSCHFRKTRIMEVYIDDETTPRAKFIV